MSSSDCSHPGEIHVVRAARDTRARHSYSGLSGYVEIVYTGVLGPSATLIYRRLCRELARQPEIAIELSELGRAVGIGPAGAMRSLKRLVDFDIALWCDGVLQVRPQLPSLSRRTVARLSDEARRVHQVATGRTSARQ